MRVSGCALTSIRGFSSQLTEVILPQALRPRPAPVPRAQLRAVRDAHAAVHAAARVGVDAAEGQRARGRAEEWILAVRAESAEGYGRGV